VRAGGLASLRTLFFTVAKHLPPGIIPSLRRVVERMVGGVQIFRRRWARLRTLWAKTHSLELPAQPVSFAVNAQFRPGDRWISLGLDWDTLADLDIYQFKQDNGLHVTRICYDIIPALLPHLSVHTREAFGAYLVDLAWSADRVLCISEQTQRDFRAFLEELGAPVPPTRVFRLGSEVRDLAITDRPHESILGTQHADERPFVLYVSTIERRKNHEILYRAWTRLRARGVTPHRLVFVGMEGWGVADMLNDIRQDPRVQNDIVILNHVGDEALARLYRQAAFTVYPSLYEGWGLPVVESLAWGKFCLCSSAASIPEAGGDWCEYLDPWDLPAWVERLGWYMAHPEAVAARNARIENEFKPPSWRTACAAIHDAVIGSPTPQGAATNPEKTVEAPA
jgi:glycosyltransferase involved in cell wall biosynthesis